MEQIIHDEKNGLDYRLVGDYYLPMLKTPEAPQIGRFGKMHYDYIRKNKKCFFSRLQLSGEINSYIAEVDSDAEEMFKKLVKQLAERDGITETLKVIDQIEWVRRMNNVRAQAIEIIKHNIIYN